MKVKDEKCSVFEIEIIQFYLLPSCKYGSEQAVFDKLENKIGFTKR